MLPARGFQLFGGHELVEKACLQKGFGVEALGEQEDAAGHLGAEAVDRAGYAGGLVVDAEPGRGREGLHADDADAEIAGEGQFDAAAIDAAVEGGDGRAGEGFERVAEPGERVVGPVGAGDVAERCAGAEAAAGAGEDEGAEGFVGGQVLQEACHFAHGGLVEGVVGLGAVEGDAGDGAVAGGADHRQSSNSAKTGAWSEGFSQPRTCLATRLPPMRAAMSGVAQMWSRRRPRSAASQSGLR